MTKAYDNARQIAIARADKVVRGALEQGDALMITVTAPTTMTWEIVTPTRDRAVNVADRVSRALTNAAVGGVLSPSMDQLAVDPGGPQRVTISLAIKLTPRERIEMRGFCTGPVDSAPAPGDVGLDYKAACRTCGRRVSVTARGRYAHHKDFQQTSRFTRGSWR